MNGAFDVTVRSVVCRINGSCQRWDVPQITKEMYNSFVIALLFCRETVTAEYD